jgi:hypothetical protein
MSEVDLLLLMTYVVGLLQGLWGGEPTRLTIRISDAAIELTYGAKHGKLQENQRDASCSKDLEPRYWLRWVSPP